MIVRRRTGLMMAGIAALFLVAFIFVALALVRVDRYRPEVISFSRENGKAGRDWSTGTYVFPIIDSD
jgi:hypothetical protein